MADNDPQGLVFAARRKDNPKTGLVRWTALLFAYPAFELLIAAFAGAAADGLSGSSLVLLHLVPATALLAAIALVFSRKAVPSYCALAGSLVYLGLAAMRETLFTLPALSVVIASVCAVVLARGLQR